MGLDLIPITPTNKLISSAMFVKEWNQISKEKSFFSSGIYGDIWKIGKSFLSGRNLKFENSCDEQPRYIKK